MPDNPPTRCAACGQVDDHPKVSVNPAGAVQTRYHYDKSCLPIDFHDADAFVARAVQLATSGVHGDELRAQLMGA